MSSEKADEMDRLVRKYRAWSEMVRTGRDADGERVIVDGAMVVEVGRQMLAEIGQAAVDAVGSIEAEEKREG